jgi:hypothetical protein
MLYLSGELAHKDGVLRIAYRVRNAGADVAYVSAVPIDNARKPYPGSAYAALTPDGLGLRLVLGLSEVPTDCNVSFRAGALAVALPPDRETSGEIRLPTPVREWNAYYPPDHPAEGWELAAAYRVVLVVEAVLSPSARFADAVADQPDLWRVGGTRTRLEKAFVPDARIPVLKRPGAFPRV